MIAHAALTAVLLGAASVPAPAVVGWVCAGLVDVDCDRPGSGSSCEVWVDPDPDVAGGVCVLERH